MKVVVNHKMFEVRKWSHWTHKKSGNDYMVLLLSNMQATREGWERTVSYQDQQGIVWSRPLTEWVDKYEEVVQ